MLKRALLTYKLQLRLMLGWSIILFSFLLILPCRIDYINKVEKTLYTFSIMINSHSAIQPYSLLISIMKDPQHQHATQPLLVISLTATHMLSNYLSISEASTLKISASYDVSFVVIIIIIIFC